MRKEDTLESLKRKVELATIMGTMQATLTDFRYLRNVWKKNTEEEALLGVSLTGIMDHPTLSGYTRGFNDDGSKTTVLEDWLETLRLHAVEVNKKWAKKFGINQAASITCVK